eukprot:3262611-Alexandrium_andersonii.AAC.1
MDLFGASRDASRCSSVAEFGCSAWSDEFVYAAQFALPTQPTLPAWVARAGRGERTGGQWACITDEQPL